jgi:hypothetical protein
MTEGGSFPAAGGGVKVRAVGDDVAGAVVAVGAVGVALAVGVNMGVGG